MNIAKVIQYDYYYSNKLDLALGIENLGHDNQILKVEVKTLQEKWKKSEKLNKKMLLELEQNVQTIKILETKIQEANINSNLNNFGILTEEHTDINIRQNTAFSNNSKESLAINTESDKNIKTLENWLETKETKERVKSSKDNVLKSV